MNEGRTNEHKKSNKHTDAHTRINMSSKTKGARLQASRALLMPCCLICGRPLSGEPGLLTPCRAEGGTLLANVCRPCWLLEEISGGLRSCADLSVRSLVCELLEDIYSLVQETRQAEATDDARAGRHVPSAAWSSGATRPRSRSRRR